MVLTCALSIQYGISLLAMAVRSFPSGLAHIVSAVYCGGFFPGGVAIVVRRI